MGDDFVRSFDDVYLIYPLKEHWNGELQGNYIPIRKMDHYMQFHCNDPEYPHMVIKYFMATHHKHRLEFFQSNQMNYYKQERRWVPVEPDKQCRKATL